MKINMVNFILITIVVVVLFLYLGNTEISFSPFKIKINEWWKPVGYIIMLIGFIIYTVGSNKKSFNDGWNKAKNEIINGKIRK